jgi:aspartyl-tRNA(Asn)/glutamyl-tRNA(Gln) amidotransferase subunit C
MKIDERLVEHVARIARLKLNKEEKTRYLRDLKEILRSFEIINEARVDRLEPAFHPIELKNVVREDVPGRSVSQETALSNTNNKEKGFFKGPKSIEW